MMFIFSPFFFFLLKRMLRPWNGGTEHTSVSLFIHNLPFIHIFCSWSAEGVALHPFGPAASSALWDDQAHCWGWAQPNYPSREIKGLSCRKQGCQQQYFGGWSSVCSRDQSKHAPAQEKNSWSLGSFPGATVTCWWTETVCFSEISLNFKHIHLVTSAKEQLEQHEPKKGWIPWLQKAEAEPGEGKA